MGEQIYYPVLWISKDDLKNAMRLKEIDEDDPIIKDIENYSKYKMRKIQEKIATEMDYNEEFIEFYWEILKNFNVTK